MNVQCLLPPPLLARRKPSDFIVTKIYQGLGLSITYPENWQVTEDFDGSELLGFQLQSPTSAFFAVYMYPLSTTSTEAINEAHRAIAAEYDEVEYDLIATPEWMSSALQLSESQAAELHFYYLDLLVQVRLFAFHVHHHTYLIHIQAEDRDFNKLERVFDALLVTLVQSTLLTPRTNVAPGDEFDEEKDGEE
jgi:hypothetical protein